jgi:ribosome-binding ATPase
MKLGLVGLPNVGKSTLFNKILGQEIAKASNFPFCTIEPNSAFAEVIDDQLTHLGEISASERVVYPRLECVDIAGLVKGASEGAGLGNKFLSNIRQVDLILHVIRCFNDDNIIHVNNKVDPIEDAKLIEMELILSDIDMCDKILSNRKFLSTFSKNEVATLEKAFALLKKDLFLRSQIDKFTEDEIKFIKDRGFITIRPMLYVANGSSNEDVESLKSQLGHEVVAIDASSESYDDVKNLVNVCHENLGLITFYTTGKKETRGWSIKKGVSAKKASAAIHTDFEKKFVAVKVSKYKDYILDKTQYETKGKDYIVQHADICDFKIGGK